MFDAEIESRARRLLDAAQDRSLRLATAESCTGGLIAAAICAIPGASSAFDRGVVAYANSAKHELLGVPGETLEREGAVSEAVALAMARGIYAPRRVTLSVTGIAGPGGGSPAKPVGTVWFGVCSDAGQHAELKHFAGLDRQGVQRAALLHGLDLLLEATLAG